MNYDSFTQIQAVHPILKFFHAPKNNNVDTTISNPKKKPDGKGIVCPANGRTSIDKLCYWINNIAEFITQKYNPEKYFQIIRIILSDLEYMMPSWAGVLMSSMELSSLCQIFWQELLNVIWTDPFLLHHPFPG